jgi:hypothetical protein
MQGADLVYDADSVKVYRTDSGLRLKKETVPWWSTFVLVPVAVCFILGPATLYLVLAIFVIGRSTPGWIAVHVLGTSFSVWLGLFWAKIFASYLVGAEATVARVDDKRLRVRGCLGSRLCWTFTLQEPVDVVILVHYDFETDKTPYIAGVQLHEHHPSGGFSGLLYRALRLERRIELIAGYGVRSETRDGAVARARPLAECIGSLLGLSVRIDELGKRAVEWLGYRKPSGSGGNSGEAGPEQP